MKEIKGRFTGSIKRTPTIKSFRFQGKEKIVFLPGQFLQVMFDRGNPGNRELNKYLSFSSSPTKDYFEVTKRISQSSFSKKLMNLKKGDEVFFKAPLGNVVFKEEYKKIGFLAGGIGITPVISIIEYITDEKLDTDVVLFYSNRNEEEIAFRQELDYWSERNTNIKICYSITHGGSQTKEYVQGRISKDLVCEGIKDISERIFFLYGPSKMVEAMEQICIEAGCQKDQIKTENFIGY